MALAGTPPTSVLGGTSLVTTDPAATTALSPIETPGRMLQQRPIQTLFPIVTGSALVGDLARQCVIVGIHDRREIPD